MEDNQKYIGVELSRTNNMLKRNWAKSEFKKNVDKVTGKNGWILSFLYENRDKDIFQKDIEQKFSIRRSTVSGIISLMEKKGFITRESVAHDARLKKLKITPKAEEMHQLMLQNLAATEESLKRGISEEELHIFFGVLEKIRKNTETGDDET